MTDKKLSEKTVLVEYVQGVPETVPVVDPGSFGFDIAVPTGATDDEVAAMMGDALRKIVGETAGPTFDGAPATSAEELPEPDDDAAAQARFDAIENARVEASLHHTFAGLGPIVRIPSDDGSLFGWTILGGVSIHRSTLPADFSGETESEDFRSHRQELLDIVRAAYMVGRHGTAEPKPSSSLNVAFAPYADVEDIIVSAVPAGTPVTRACAGGDLGWRVGWGWLSVEGSDPSRPDQIRDFARSLAAIPPMKWEKARNGDPELVEKTLKAGRAM